MTTSRAKLFFASYAGGISTETEREHSQCEAFYTDRRQTERKMEKLNESEREWRLLVSAMLELHFRLVSP